MNKLTVALCTYNRGEYLAESMEGILSQTFRDFDLIIYDNASTDNTKHVVESFKDPRIKYLYFSENVGMSGNWLRAVKDCRTKYLSIAHDDDIWETTLLERELEIMEKDEELVLISCRSRLINEYGEFIEKEAVFTDIEMDKYGYCQLALDYNGIFAMTAPSAMFRANVLDKIDYGFFEYTGSVADTYWYLKLNEIGKLYLIGDALLRYRRHPGQYSANALSAKKEHRDYIYPLLATWVQSDRLDNIRHSCENDIKISEFSLSLTDEFEKNCIGYYFPNHQYADKDLLARIKFLNHIARGNQIEYVIWGAGGGGLKTKIYFDIMLPNFKLIGFIDKFKKGTCEGLPILSPDEYIFDKSAYVIIATSLGGFDAMEFLKEKGLKIKQDFMIGNIN